MATAPSWSNILLDNQSNVHIFFCALLLSNIRTATKPLQLETQAGTAIVTEVGDFPGVGEVYLFRQGIANILSFHQMAKVPGVHIDSSTRADNPHTKGRDCFAVELPSGQ